ncbi:hypothetical protein K488DRAFT_77108 [Vararia minispora EC-137]|uniref:Uncharacterized protein n=1 Tax=Vararia minispora EC-137 TaxID=1314806 RepID=A0ACB8QS97_9AGAM|nr:hypothetical protein K488DRAFT_77108 [Vararia minispora EC-137]
MAPPTVYTSSSAPVSFPESSVSAYLFSRPHDPSKIAYIDGLSGVTLSRAALRSQSLRLACGARRHLGLKRGDTALVLSPNSSTYAVVLLALFAVGAPATLANAAYTPPELAHQYTNAHAHLLFVHPALLSVAHAMFDRIGINKTEAACRIIVMDLEAEERDGLTALGALLDENELEEEKFDGQDADETAVICYSSGTTGLPKGVETTHKNLTAQLAMLGGQEWWNDDDVFLAVLPVFHVYGLVTLLLLPLLLGAPVVLLPRFIPDVFFGVIDKHRVTMALIVPPILLAFIHHPASTKNDLTSLRVLISGAAPLSIELTKAINDRLASLGARAVLTQGFGMTELSPVSHICHPSSAPHKPASIGALLPNLHVRLVVSADALTDADPGEPGEMWIRGPTVMKGYVRNPKATEETISKDGWLKTGDIAVRDEDGFFWIVDRKKELIKYKGFQVSPAELEDVLLSHPDVVDAAVIGIDDHAQSTELPRAYVVSKPGSTLAISDSFEKDVQTFVAANVAGHKRLRGGVAAIEAIPRSASGKILRRELRELAKTEAVKA